MKFPQVRRAENQVIPVTFSSLQDCLLADRGSAIYAAYDARSREDAMDYETEHSASGKYSILNPVPTIQTKTDAVTFSFAVLTTEAIQGAKKFTAGWGRLVQNAVFINSPTPTKINPHNL